MLAYPVDWEADVVLRDGGTCHLRPITPADVEALRTFYSHLSERTIYFRFFAPYPRLSERDLHRFTSVDYQDRVALVATIGDQIIGVVRYDRVTVNDAEVAFVIRDDHQGRGLGTIFLEHIAQAARERAVHCFVAEVLPENERMLEVFEHAGYVSTKEIDDGIVHLEFDIKPTLSSLEVMHAREQRAEALSVHRLLSPRSVAVVGASRDPQSVGFALLTHLRDGGFTGSIHAVNPAATEIDGVPSAPRLTDVGTAVELALIATPADAVPSVIADAAVAGVHGLVVVSAGFAEMGPPGRHVQSELVRLARANGMRLVGPNAMGLINTDPAISLNASMAPRTPARGSLGFFSQSGALGVSLLDAAAHRGLGLSSFVSAGNRADISGNDLLQYWDEDERTDVVMLYLESIGNPRKFSRISRRLSLRKPIIAVKSGRSTQGVPLGENASRSQMPPEAVEQMFRQSGVIRTDTVSQMFDVAQLLSTQPLPAGERVLAIGNSDAMVLMAEDAVSVNGLEWVDPPIVFNTDVSPSQFELALAGAIDDPAVDCILTMYVPAIHDSGDDVAAALSRVAARAAKPVVAVMYSVESFGTLRQTPESAAGRMSGAVPTYPAVEDAVRAVAGAAFHARWRRTVTEFPVDPAGVDVDRGRALVTEWLRENPEGLALEQDSLSQLLGCYGINLWPRGTARSVEEAVALAADLGYPVVLKTVDAHLRLRSDLGGIYFDIDDEQDLRRQYAARLRELQPLDYDRLVVQRQAQAGAAVVLETREDPLFGPVMSFGLAGVAYDVLDDRAYAIPPTTSSDIDALIDGPKAASLLANDERGSVLSLTELRDLIARVSRLAYDLPELSQLTLRPIVVASGGTAVLGGEAHIRTPAARFDLPARRLLG